MYMYKVLYNRYYCGNCCSVKINSTKTTKLILNTKLGLHVHVHVLQIINSKNTTVKPLRVDIPKRGQPLKRGQSKCPKCTRQI